MPTSITDRAGLDRIGADQPRHADRGDQHVGAGADGGEVAGARVADRHRRVGAPAAGSRPGAPTSFERPTTTASAPSSSTPSWREQLDHAGGRARAPGPACRWRAGRRWSGSGRRRPCRGSIARDHRVGVDVLGQRQLDEDAVDVVVGVERADQRRAARPRWSSPRARGGPSASRPPRRPCACCARRSPRPGRRRPAPSPGRARGRPRRRTRRPRPRTRSRTSAATALPSMIRARHRLSLPDRRVVGHQLALGAVAGEAHDDHAAGLDRR